MVTDCMKEIKLIEGLIVAAETLGGEVIFFSLSGILFIYLNLFFISILLSVISKTYEPNNNK